MLKATDWEIFRHYQLELCEETEKQRYILKSPYLSYDEYTSEIAGGLRRASIRKNIQKKTLSEKSGMIMR